MAIKLVPSRRMATPTVRVEAERSHGRWQAREQRPGQHGHMAAVLSAVTAAAAVAGMVAQASAEENIQRKAGMEVRQAVDIMPVVGRGGGRLRKPAAFPPPPPSAAAAAATEAAVAAGLVPAQGSASRTGKTAGVGTGSAVDKTRVVCRPGLLTGP